MNKSLREISRIILGLPEIQSGFIQHTEALDHQKAVKNSGGGYDMGDRYRSEFRCFLRTSDKHAERIADSPARAALETLEAIGIQCPHALV